MNEREQWWYFTFGYGHKPGIGHYAKFYGTQKSAREDMCNSFGLKWAFQYPSAEAAGVEEFNLKGVVMKILSADLTTYTVENTCPFCGKVQSIVIPQDSFINWQNGELIQRAFPELSADDRELLMTGICNDCFPKDED